MSAVNIDVNAEQTEQTEQLHIRSWAECKTDLEMELGLPASKRKERIDELIARRNNEIRQTKKLKEEELLPLAKATDDNT